MACDPNMACAPNMTLPRRSLYGPIKNAMGITPGQPVPLWKKIVAGGTAGAVASAVANPTDLMKVRLQTDGMMK
eukprot:6292678-Prymnesium_polylepis.1